MSNAPTQADQCVGVDFVSVIVCSARNDCLNGQMYFVVGNVTCFADAYVAIDGIECDFTYAKHQFVCRQPSKEQLEIYCVVDVVCINAVFVPRES